MRRRPVTLATGIAGAIDRFASVVSPRWYRSRVQERTAASLITALAPYRGSEANRLRADWVASDGSADHDTLFDIETLRERTRDLIRNDGAATGMLGTIVRNTVGTGVRPQSRVDGVALGLDKKQVREFQRTAEAVFRRWMPFADARHELDFFGLQRLICRSFNENGDILIVIRNLPLESTDGRRRPFSTAVELIEADRLGTPGGFPQRKNPDTGYEIRGGIERNPEGQAVAYWILNRHPGDYGFGVVVSRSASDYTRVPKYDENGVRRVIHLMDPLRIGQSRGVSGFAPVLSDYKDLQDVMEAERVAQRIAACFGLIHKTGNPYGTAEDMSSDSDDDGNQLESMSPGMVERIGINDSIEQINPLRPGNNFDPFIMRCMRIIGAGQGVPYEATSMDYSQVNFASGRCARIDARVTFLIQQDILSRAWQSVYEAVLEEAFTLRMLPEFTRFNFLRSRDLYTRASWIGPGYGYVQPDKEVAAAREGILLGTSTLAAECSLTGTDWQENLEQQQLEAEYRAELGLAPLLPAPAKGEAEDNGDPDEEHLPEKKKPTRAVA